jgi:hypothetical protein
MLTFWQRLRARLEQPASAADASAAATAASAVFAHFIAHASNAREGAAS